MGQLAIVRRAGRPRMVNRPRGPSGNTMELRGQAREAEVRSIAAAQPHRRGAERPLEPLRTSAAGRLIDDKIIIPGPGQTINDLMGAVRQLERLYGTVSARISAPHGLRVSEGGSGADMDADKAAKAEADWAKMGRHLRQSGPDGAAVEKETYALVLDHHHEDWICPHRIAHYGGMGLRLLVEWFPRS